MKIGFVGAGRMGRPMLERLQAAGHPVTVFVRRPEARAALEAAGIRCAHSLAATVRDAAVVFSVVQTDAQVQSVCLGPEGAIAHMQPGASLVQHTTCDPLTVERVAAEATPRGIGVLDAALSGGPHDIAAGTLTLWIGGEPALFDRLRPLLASYASPILAVGPIGHGQRIKLVNNALFVAQVGLVLDASRLARALGVDAAPWPALQHGSAASRALDVVARAGSVEAIAQRLSGLMGKDVDVMRQVATRADVDLGIIGQVLDSPTVEQQLLARVPATSRGGDTTQKGRQT